MRSASAARGALGRAAADDHRAAGERAPAVRRRVGVALAHLDAARVDAELVGGDLGERRQVALAVARGADVDASRPPVGSMRASARVVARGHRHLALVERLGPVAGALGEAREAEAEQAALVARGALALARTPRVERVRAACSSASR